MAFDSFLKKEGNYLVNNVTFGFYKDGQMIKNAKCLPQQLLHNNIDSV